MRSKPSANRLVVFALAALVCLSGCTVQTASVDSSDDSILRQVIHDLNLADGESTLVSLTTTDAETPKSEPREEAIVLTQSDSTYTLWTVSRQNRDFVCLLTNERLVCQSPDESMARSFDVPIIEIVKLAEADQMEGGPHYSIQTQTGESFTLTCNFGNPAWSFFEELQKLLPSIPVEKS